MRASSALRSLFFFQWIPYTRNGEYPGTLNSEGGFMVIQGTVYPVPVFNQGVFEKSKSKFD
jgi:hypothetical protein